MGRVMQDRLKVLARPIRRSGLSELPEQIIRGEKFDGRLGIPRVHSLDQQHGVAGIRKQKAGDQRIPFLTLSCATPSGKFSKPVLLPGIDDRYALFVHLQAKTSGARQFLSQRGDADHDGRRVLKVGEGQIPAELQVELLLMGRE